MLLNIRNVLVDIRVRLEQIISILQDIDEQVEQILKIMEMK